MGQPARVIDLNQYARQDDPMPQQGRPQPVNAAIDVFRDAMATAGLGRPEIEPDGSIQRFPCPGEKDGKKAGWAVFYPDNIPSGAFGSFKGEEFSQTWSSRANYELSTVEVEAVRERFRQARAARDAERERLARECSVIAADKWAKARDDDGSHPYLQKKQVGAFGVRSAGKELLIPMWEASGTLRSLQRIFPDGGRRFLHGTVKAGSFGWIEGDQGVIYVAEGYATAASLHMATGHAVGIGFDAGNMESAAKAIKEVFPQAKIVIAADNDRWTTKNDGTPWNVGIEKAQRAAHAIGAEVCIPEFMSLEGNPTDFNDLHVREGLDRVRRQLDKNPTRELEFLPVWEMLKQPKLTEWLVKNYLEADTLTVLFGESGTMKSFVALDLGLCIASGTPWHGNEVKNSGPVFYIAGEGFRGLPARLKAWCLANGAPETIPFFVSSRPAQFLDAASALQVRQAVEKMTEEHGKPKTLIVDTLSRCFGPGDENSTADMTAFVNALDDIRISLGCSILVVHHSGLADKGRSRGSSVLKGALDFEYMLEKNSEGMRTLHCKKAKDHEEPASIVFKPETVPLGWVDSETGEEMTSCVLRKERTAKIGRPRLHLTGSNKVALEVLGKLLEEKADQSRGKINLGPAGAHIDDWRDAAYSASITTSSDLGSKQKAFKRAVISLVEKGFVGTENDYYWML
ncbi:MAG: AAA family ATPase [Desulfomicrobium sp.]